MFSCLFYACRLPRYHSVGAGSHHCQTAVHSCLPLSSSSAVLLLAHLSLFQSLPFIPIFCFYHQAHFSSWAYALKNFFGDIFYLRWCKGRSALEMKLYILFSFFLSCCDTCSSVNCSFVQICLHPCRIDTLHPIVPQLCGPRLLGICSSHNPPRCQECDRINVRLFHSPASTRHFFFSFFSLPSVLLPALD